MNRTIQGNFYRLPDKIETIAEDNKLAGHLLEARANDDLTALLASVRK